MKRFSPSIILLSSFMVVSCGSLAHDESFESKTAYLAPEATAAEAEISYWDLPYLEKAFIDAAPADRNDALVVGELGEDGGNKDKIVKLAQEIADNKHGNYDSLLISHKGKLLFESYLLARSRQPAPLAGISHQTLCKLGCWPCNATGPSDNG